MNITWVIIIFAAGVLFYVWMLYNSLIRSKIRVKEAWSGIDVQLKRRSSLIPNLVESVKAYAKHEKSVFENVTKARTSIFQEEEKV